MKIFVLEIVGDNMRANKQMEGYASNRSAKKNHLLGHFKGSLVGQVVFHRRVKRCMNNPFLYRSSKKV